MMHKEILPRQRIGTDSIVSDGKVFEEGVERKRNMLRNGEYIGDVLVVKHPNSNVYAVLDGHHAFEAYKAEGVREIECLVIDDPIGVLFELTKEGKLQPGIQIHTICKGAVQEIGGISQGVHRGPRKDAKKTIIDD